MKDYMQEALEKLKALEKELGCRIDVEVEPDIGELSPEQLTEYLGDLEERLEELEDNEPEDEDSDEYADWEDKRDHTEELIEEVSETIENLQ